MVFQHEYFIFKQLQPAINQFDPPPKIFIKEALSSFNLIFQKHLQQFHL